MNLAIEISRRGAAGEFKANQYDRLQFYLWHHVAQVPVHTVALSLNRRRSHHSFFNHGRERARSFSNAAAADSIFVCCLTWDNIRRTK